MARYARDEIAPALSAVAGAANTIQAMGQRNTLFNQSQADRATAESEKTQYREGLDTYSKTGDVPDTIPGDIAVKVKQTHASGLRADKAISDNKDSASIKELANVFVGKGNLNVDDNIRGKHSPTVVAQAQAAAANLMTNSKEGKMAFYAKRKQETNQEYGMVEQYKKNIATANLAGDRKSAAAMISEMTERLSIPYKYSYNPESDSFDEYYLHSGSGGFEKTNNSVSFQEAMAKINELTPDKFAMASYQFKEATRQWNEDARKPIGDPGKNGKGQTLKNNGKEFYVFPQKPVVGTGAVHYIVMDDQNNETTFTSIEALNNAGFRYTDPKAEKAKADLAYTQQQTKTSEAAMNSHNRANTDKGMDSSKKQLDVYDKQIKAYLGPFDGGSSGFVQNDDGSFDFNSSGQTAFTKAQDFLYQHKDDYNTLTGKEKLKFEAARKADGLYRFMLNGFSQKGKPIPDQMAVSHKKFKTTYSTDEAQKMGAKQLPDGRWAVPSDIKGKAKVINVDDGSGRKAIGGNPEGQSSMSNKNTESDRMPLDQVSKLPKDPKQWKVRYVETGLNQGEHFVIDSNGNERKITDEEYAMYIEALRGPQKESASLLGAMGNAINNYNRKGLSDMTSKYQVGGGNRQLVSQ